MTLICDQLLTTLSYQKNKENQHEGHLQAKPASRNALRLATQGLIARHLVTNAAHRTWQKLGHDPARTVITLGVNPSWVKGNVSPHHHHFKPRGNVHQVISILGSYC
jgi:hypothetical protein